MPGEADHLERRNEAPAPPREAPTIVKSTSVNQDLHPDLEQVRSVMLKDGPRVWKQARHTVVRNRHTGAIHHDALVIETTRRIKGILARDKTHTLSLSSEDGDEIQKLIDFLLAVRSGALSKTTSQYVVVTAPAKGTNAQALRKLVTDVSAAGKIDVLSQVLHLASQDPEVFQALLDRASKDATLFSEAAAALNLASYKSAVDLLEQMVAASPELPEREFQTFLTRHPWMFGSEYSELLERRNWNRDEKTDFVVRRTTDGYIEVIEIKTTLGDTALFNYDGSHDSFYAGADLSKSVGQVEKYIESLDCDRMRILALDQEDTNKIRSKIIIGRDGDSNQQKALRRFNGHLHRIEVSTFDQLVRIAKQVLRYLEHAASPADSEK